MTAEERADRFEALALSLADNSAQMLEEAARGLERQRDLIRMVEERDRLIAELRHRLRLLAMPNGLAGWEGTD